jgi:hypothetical protein
MDPREKLLHIYQELADWYERQRQPQMRDRFLVLAADAALLAGRNDEAERLRQRLLKANPHHMLKPYASFAQALKAPDVETYVKELRANYPVNVAEDLLRTVQEQQSREPGGVPVTAPVIDIGGPQPAGLPPSRAPGRADPVPPTIPLQKPAARPIPAAPLRPAPRRAVVAPLPPAPYAAAPADEPAATPGAWLGALLFLVVLACAAALAGFTFLRPYLPMP